MNFENLPRYMALVHGPVLNKRGEIVTTSVTNLDIHDLARLGRTYGVKKVFFITPFPRQHEIVGRLLDHWKEDEAKSYNSDRHDALSVIELVDSVEAVDERIRELEGEKPSWMVTGANFKDEIWEINEAKDKLALDNKPLLLLFGTGWGLAPEIVNRADWKLCPIYGSSHDGFNHLSVRAAVAIYCDRLWGVWPENTRVI